MLLTLEEREQCQLLGIATALRGDKRSLVVCRAVEGLEFVGSQGRFETRIGGAFDGRHTWQAPSEVSEKGCAVRRKTRIVFPGRSEYRIRVREGEDCRISLYVR